MIPQNDYLCKLTFVHTNKYGTTFLECPRKTQDIKDIIIIMTVFLLKRLSVIGPHTYKTAGT